VKTLVICVDRDDDIGQKVGIKSPVIGRDANIKAATQLALFDPEDSDINTIFGAIQTYDELKTRGVDAEVVLIGGSPNVGVQSDLAIADHLDAVLGMYKADRVLVVTDGAEDEFVLPIIESRAKVNTVRRIVVKQSQNLESTYYVIKELFSDPKISRAFFVPFGLACIIYAISLIAGYPQGAVIAITAFVGVYLLFRGFGLDDIMEDFAENLKHSFYGGKISFVTYIAAIIFGLIGIVQGLVYCLLREPQGVMIIIVTFINASVWWFVAGGLFSSVGRLVDAYLGKERVWRYWVLPFFISAAGLILWGGSKYVLSVNEFGFTMNAIQNLLASIIGAVIIASIGAAISTYIRRLKKGGIPA